jgi:hypothetical protein
VQAGQGDPLGPELSPIDPSFAGKHVTVTTHKAVKTPIDMENEKDIPYPSRQ